MKRKPITKARRMQLIALHGDRCINCGSPDEIEWHHVVPLEIGGNDVDTNLVPLCYSCHKAVTHHELLLKTSGRQHKTGGRKRIVPDNYKEILHDYLYGKISKTECTIRLGLSSRNKGWMSDSPWMDEYLAELGIKTFRNNIELKANKGSLAVSSNVGYIKYLDGTTEDIFYNPDGQPDAKVVELLEKSKVSKPREKRRKLPKIIGEIDAEIKKESTSDADKKMWREYKRKILLLHN